MPILSYTAIEYKITTININAIDLSIQLVVARGVIENSVFNPINEKTFNISQADTQILMNTAPVGTTIYETLKTVLYDYLLDNQLMTGTVQ